MIDTGPIALHILITRLQAICWELNSMPSPIKSQHEYKLRRTEIINALYVSIDSPQSLKFDENSELVMDIDIMIDFIGLVTTELYPPGTQPMQEITYDQRALWCETILEYLDGAIEARC